MNESDAVELLVEEHPEGISRPDIEVAFSERYGRSIHWRTLLRRLNALIDQGRVATEGESTARVYVPGPARISEVLPVEHGYIPMSRGGARLRTLIRRPIIERAPVGYDASLLEAYVPGTTWYLPASMRASLHEMGRTPDAERPAGTYAREIFGRLLIDLAWASSRLEGNTYSRLDTLNLLEFGQHAEGRDATEAQMILAL